MKTCIGCRINRIVWPKVDTALMKHGPCYMPSQVLGDLNEHKDVQRLGFCSCGCRQDANSLALPEFEMPLRRHFILSPQLYSNTPRGTPHGKHPISSQKKNGHEKGSNSALIELCLSFMDSLFPERHYVS